MRFVKRSVQFFKAEDQIGRGCDRELASAIRDWELRLSSLADAVFPQIAATAKTIIKRRLMPGSLYLQHVAQARILEHAVQLCRPL